jgi:hypothetical protein
LQKLVILILLSVAAGCRGPEPVREVFGEDLWDFVQYGVQWEFYQLSKAGSGPVVAPGGLRIASSGRSSSDIGHKVWSFLQDYEAFDIGSVPGRAPRPQFILKIEKGPDTAFIAIDVDSGFLSLYPKGRFEHPKWLGFGPAKQRMKDLLSALFELRFSQRSKNSEFGT